MRRLALLVVVLPLAACGGGGKKEGAPAASAAPVDLVEHAAVKTAHVKSEHLVMTASATVSGTSLTVNGSGDFDNASHRGVVHATFGASGMSGDIDEVMDGTTMYLHSPLFSSTLPAGKTWLKLDLQSFGKAHGIDFSALLGQSPTQALAQLQGVEQVTKVGEETIDGVPTTHYRERIDPKMLPQGAQIEALTHAKYGPVDIWIGNDDGYVHRYRMATTLSENGHSVTTATTVDLSKYGEAVTVDVPPASATVDGTSTALQGLTS